MELSIENGDANLGQNIKVLEETAQFIKVKYGSHRLHLVKFTKNSTKNYITNGNKIKDI